MSVSKTQQMSSESSAEDYSVFGCFLKLYLQELYCTFCLEISGHVLLLLLLLLLLYYYYTAAITAAAAITILLLHCYYCCCCYYNYTTTTLLLLLLLLFLPYYYYTAVTTAAAITTILLLHCCYYCCWYYYYTTTTTTTTALLLVLCRKTLVWLKHTTLISSNRTESEALSFLVREWIRASPRNVDFVKRILFRRYAKSNCSATVIIPRFTSSLSSRM
jgi:hypothetical protein